MRSRSPIPLSSYGDVLDPPQGTAVLAALLLTGCGDRDPPAPEPSEPPSTPEPHEVSNYRTPTAADRGLPCVLDQVPASPGTAHSVRLKKDGFSFIVVDNHGADNGEFNGLGFFEFPSREFGILFPAWNFEHIFDGVQHDANKGPSTARIFEPRHAAAIMDLAIHGTDSATLRQRPTPFWGLESATRFTVHDKRTVDIEFSARLTRPTPKTRWFGLFWASYPSSGKGRPIWFPGRAEAGRPVVWIRGSAADHLVANTWVHEDSSAPISFIDGYPQKLFTTTAQAPELVSHPVFFAELPEGLTFVTMLDGGSDVRLTQSPVTAWDAQWIVHGWEVGACYTMRARLLIDEEIPPAEVLREYATWMGQEPLELPAPKLD